MTDVKSLSEHQRIQALKDLILQEIAKSQTIDFAQFMQLVLYSDVGYYQAKPIILGESGDFITAPELTDLFASCLAEQCIDVLSKVQNGSILEFGAGSGNLAHTLMLMLDQLNCVPEHYYIIEPSNNLRSMQKKKIASLPPKLQDKMTWLSEVPENFTGVLLANEVLDAMPVHRFRIDAQHIFEYYIKTDFSQNLQWELKEITQGILFEKCSRIKNRYLTEDIMHYSSECNLGIPLFLQTLVKKIKQGVLLIIDYGYHASEYYHPERSQGTLTCFYQHQHHNNPLINLGNQDISAHVNFTQVAEESQQAGFEVLGYTHQAAFLLNCGLLEKIQDHNQLNIKQHIQTLTLPTEMGELIKVLALAKNFSHDLLGFKSYNKRHYLEN